VSASRLDFDEQKRSGFRYQYSNYQIEYSRNLVFEVGGHMDQVFQALIDRSRAPLDLKTIRACVEASLADLEEDEVGRLGELSILPEDENVPLGVIGALWAERSDVRCLLAGWSAHRHRL
jgi:hypothetical protein